MPAGSTPSASEIIPGFLWIGNAASAKSNPVNNLGITLVINCTSTLKNPAPRPPYYRCHDAPLDETPKDKSPEAICQILDHFHKCYDWIEWERSHFERSDKVDFPTPEWRGPTDKYGKPVIEPGQEEKKPTRPEYDGKSPPSRVLMWSRLGFDRPCAVVAAYLVSVCVCVRACMVSVFACMCACVCIHA